VLCKLIDVLIDTSDPKLSTKMKNVLKQVRHVCLFYISGFVCVLCFDTLSETRDRLHQERPGLTSKFMNCSLQANGTFCPNVTTALKYTFSG
jgi:TRAP-type C4-dicarboxylate transport system permease small subunit